MKLKELIKSRKGDSVEVIDKEVDISCPLYLDSETLKDYEEDTAENSEYLCKLLKLVYEQEIVEDRGYTVVIDMYSVCENCPEIVDEAEDEGYEIWQYTEDVYTILSQGFYNSAKRFCRYFGIK